MDNFSCSLWEKPANMEITKTKQNKNDVNVENIKLCELVKVSGILKD